MATNLTPQYHKAEEQYRRATTAEEELKWLQVMLREMPKHKASEKLQSELKQKISRLKQDVETERKSGKRGFGIRIPRQGAGTVVVLGGPNAGKSQLVRSLTRATPEVAPYPFTTRVPLPGMMPWEDVMVQLIDMPPITSDILEPYAQGLIRGADLALVLVDLGSDEGLEQCQELFDKLNTTKTRLARESSLDEEDLGLSFTRCILVPNKIDLPDAVDRLTLFDELYPHDLPRVVVSAQEGAGLDDLRETIYRALDVIRVYTKLPTAKEADRERPFTLRRGSTVLDLAEQVHKEFVEKFRFARVWGSTVHDATVVKGDFELSDKDVVELHVT